MTREEFLENWDQYQKEGLPSASKHFRAAVDALIAAAREEQREACAQDIENAFEEDQDVAAIDVCREAPLTATPLADRLKIEAEEIRALNERIYMYRTIISVDPKQAIEANKDLIKRIIGPNNVKTP